MRQACNTIILIFAVFEALLSLTHSMKCSFVFYSKINWLEITYIVIAIYFDSAVMRLYIGLRTCFVTFMRETRPRVVSVPIYNQIFIAKRSIRAHADPTSICSAIWRHWFPRMHLATFDYQLRAMQKLCTAYTQIISTRPQSYRRVLHFQGFDNYYGYHEPARWRMAFHLGHTLSNGGNVFSPVCMANSPQNVLFLVVASKQFQTY